MVQSEQLRTIVIMAGGTGGHIFPALAVASELESHGYYIHWLGTPDGMEAEIVPRHGFDISYIPVGGLRGKRIGVIFKSLWFLMLSVLKAVKILRQHNPCGVLGMGGYVTGPGGVAAKLLGIPLIIHEQNAISGLTNRLLSKIALRVLEAFPGAFSRNKKSKKKINKKIFITGNPVRYEICLSGIYNPSIPLKLLVLGGSRGAVAINEVVLQVFASYGEQLKVWHQTGKNNFEQCQKQYKVLSPRGIKPYKVDAFIDDMAKAYAWADVVLCRSGALTVSELAVAGRPSILIPYPYAVDDHQTFNGIYLVDLGAARLIPQEKLNKTVLTELLIELSSDSALLESMAASAKIAGRIKATQVVAEHCQEVFNG